MTIANSLAMWQKGGTQVRLVTTSTGSGAPHYILHDDSQLFLPDPAKAVIRRSLHTGGGPQPRSQEYVLGRPAAVAGQLRLPLTPIGLAIVFQSILQSSNYSSSRYLLGPYSSAATTLWMYVEGGIAGADTVGKGFGGRITKATINVPAATDSDPGDPMIICDVLFCNATRADAFTGGGTPITDTAEPYTGEDLTITVAGSTLFLSGEITFDTGLTKSKTVAAAASGVPSQLYANRLSITGNVACYGSSSGSDPHQTLITNHDAKTAVEMGLTIEAGANDHTIVWDALMEAPTTSEDDGMLVYSFGFTNVNDNGDQPTVSIYTDDMGW